MMARIYEQPRGKALTRMIDGWVAIQTASFIARETERLGKLRIDALLKSVDPFAYTLRQHEPASDLVAWLIDASVSNSHTLFLHTLLERLAVLVACEASQGQRSSAPGVDIELTRDGACYLIAVKHGQMRGSEERVAAQKRELDAARRAYAMTGRHEMFQGMLGFCYGNSATLSSGTFTQTCGPEFWHFLSAEKELYAQTIEPLGLRVPEFDAAFSSEKSKAYNRITKDFIASYCQASYAIDGKKLMRFVCAH